jgi:hypothetical protein
MFKTIIRVLVSMSASLPALMSASALAYDNGPQVIGCDYKLGKSAGTTKCLIVGSGTNQGVSWLVFEVQGKRFRYSDADEDKIERVNRSGDTLSAQPVERTTGPCRPGGKSADVFEFKNGDRVCLYWP